MTKNKNKSKFNVFRLGLVLVFLSLVFLTANLLTKVVKNSSSLSKETQKVSESKNVQKQNTDIDLAWEIYMNGKYGFQIETPKLLYKVESQDLGRYLTFIRFEENNFSQEKGVAIGVSKESFEKEIELIKKELEGMGGKLVKEEDLTINGTLAKKFEFQPEKEGEARSFLIINFNNISVSISTVPEQIDRVIESFKLL
ncbi:MAG: hypothetical protein UT24_C0017G0019 [Candidatus Woesebacteria bacterium GW2011_GWB1_39_12]|uniref:Uncharacterized protein n=2 Tax=Candidatus Woeseibacteriota TaxID=1752722 RepID=A0A0G0M1A5_9BACT|nr:MAG: hypothetical protein UT23_C0006G0004 [Candidatus Woesebacteria bacterium GW2011_GWA1_39_12]KKR00093.1 MAG: hypothetical protein UT24_C0017G0019 [Candidatus Woesebacteria bacterium GW2011_GWB1_39_12]